jgi:hypothetical protein
VGAVVVTQRVDELALVHLRAALEVALLGEVDQLVVGELVVAAGAPARGLVDRCLTQLLGRVVVTQRRGQLVLGHRRAAAEVAVLRELVELLLGEVS